MFPAAAPISYVFFSNLIPFFSHRLASSNHFLRTLRSMLRPSHHVPGHTWPLAPGKAAQSTPEPGPVRGRHPSVVSALFGLDRLLREVRVVSRCLVVDAVGAGQWQPWVARAIERRQQSRERAAAMVAAQRVDERVTASTF